MVSVLHHQQNRFQDRHLQRERVHMILLMTKLGRNIDGSQQTSKSWLGGRPKLAGADWPRDPAGAAMHFVGQFDLGEISECSGKSFGGTTGSIACFAALDDVFDHAAAVHIKTDVTKKESSDVPDDLIDLHGDDFERMFGDSAPFIEDRKTLVPFAVEFQKTDLPVTATVDEVDEYYNDNPIMGVSWSELGVQGKAPIEEVRSILGIAQATEMSPYHVLSLAYSLPSDRYQLLPLALREAMAKKYPTTEGPTHHVFGQDPDETGYLDETQDMEDPQVLFQIGTDHELPIIFFDFGQIRYYIDQKDLEAGNFDDVRGHIFYA